MQGLKKQEPVNVDSSPDMDSYEVISGKSNPSSPSIEDLGAVGGGLYDEMTPENDLSRDSEQGVASFDPNLNVNDKEGQDFNEMEGDKHDFGAEEEEEEQEEEEVQLGNDDDDDAEYDGSDGTDEDKVESNDEEDNIEVTLQDNLENSDDDEHPDLRKRLLPQNTKK